MTVITMGRLREALVPRGESDVVLLRPGQFGFLESDSAQVKKLLDELEGKLSIWASKLEEPSELEKLAVRLLAAASEQN